MRKYSHKFEEEDAADDAADSAEQIAHRRRLVDEWNTWRQRCKKELAEERGQTFGKDKHADEQKEEIEVWIDEVIDQIEEVVVE